MMPLIIASLCALGAACSEQETAQSTFDSTGGTAIVHRDSSSRIDSARTRLIAFLEGALETNAPLSFDRYWACEPEGQTDTYFTLGDFEVLSLSADSDSIILAAVRVVSVAEESGDSEVADRYRTRVRIRQDTLHYQLAQDRASGAWGVCGYPQEGVSFGHYGSNGATSWDPSGFTWAKVRAVADSVRRARP
jgi:hypothetical protein